MTTYNGSLFVFQQVASILNQLGVEDELIICDDGSSDDTIAIINEFNDNRIKLHINDVNLGHVGNFQKALNLAQGDYIFLSDQDDIWAEDKVSICLNALKDDKVIMVHHGIQTIDSNGEFIQSDYLDLSRCKLTKQNIFSVMRFVFFPRFFGCALAFKRELLEKSPGFSKATYAHDHFLCLCALKLGDVEFVDEPLISYRQHSCNLTPKKRSFSFAMVRRRASLLFDAVKIYKFRGK
ncbi:glycosyltransferase [Vibrio harveyi]|nr:MULTISPECIES: glycosyltransferase [Vibrio]